MKDVTIVGRRVIGAPRPQCHSPISPMARWEMRTVEEPMNGFVDSLLTCDEQGDANTPFKLSYTNYRLDQEIQFPVVQHFRLMWPIMIRVAEKSRVGEIKDWSVLVFAECAIEISLRLEDRIP